MGIDKLPTLNPTELRSAPRRFRHLEEFVDRINEFEQFNTLIENSVEERDKRILAFYGQVGIGKTVLLDRLEYECSRRKIAYSRLNLEDGTLNNVLLIMRELAQRLGGEPFQLWSELEREWYSPPKIIIEDKGIHSPIEIEANTVVVKGDIIGGNKTVINSQVTKAALDPQGAQIALTESFLNALEEFVRIQPVVLLFDGFDHDMFAVNTRKWLMDVLLDRARDLKGFGVLPVISLHDRPRFERSLEFDTYLNPLKPLTQEYIEQYFKLCRLPDEIILEATQACLIETKGIPSKVYEHVELLLQAIKESMDA